jgi:AcrR family transcriptional regulator
LRTRQAISDIATQLFIERGFDQVTVAEVAEAADVSVNTVFNYFSTKEELFFDRGDALIDEPSRIVRERGPGESAVGALYRGYRAAIADNASAFQARKIRPFLATIEKSSTLKLRFRTLLDETEQRLAETLAADTNEPIDDPTARVVAALLTSIEWLLIQEFRSRLLAGQSGAKIRAALLRAVDRSFGIVRSGISDYARQKKDVSGASKASSKSRRPPTFDVEP